MTGLVRQALSSPLALAMLLAAASPGALLSQEEVVRSDGARLLPVQVAAGSLQNPCWVSSGAKLVLTWFSEGYNRGGSGLWLLQSNDGAIILKLTTAADTNVNMPGACWDPTGGIVFSSDPNGADQAFTVSAEGGAPLRITRPPQVAWEPTFSPDGKWIVFESHKNGADGEIWKIGVDGTGLTQLSSGWNDRQPNWGPGDLIAFQRHSGGQVDLWVMDTDGDGEQNVTGTPLLEETDVSWSPSGEWLVFSSDGSDVDVASLFTIRLDGAERRRLTEAPGRYDGAPAWSPDGKTIAFESFDGDPDGGPGTRIWTINAPPGRN